MFHGDFPHGRENCVEIPWTRELRMQHCPQCYCYVCDIPAAQCAQWSHHCRATCKDHRWRLMRENMKKEAMGRQQRKSSTTKPLQGPDRASSETSKSVSRPMRSYACRTLMHALRCSGEAACGNAKCERVKKWISVMEEHGSSCRHCRPPPMLLDLNANIFYSNRALEHTILVTSSLKHTRDIIT